MSLKAAGSEMQGPLKTQNFTVHWGLVVNKTLSYQGSGFSPFIHPGLSPVCSCSASAFHF